MTIEEFELLIKNPEGSNLELKQAKYSFNEDKDLPDYCAAIANERGGKLILGVSNDGVACGTNVYNGTLHKIPNEIFSKLKIRVNIEEINHSQGRVLVFHIPSRSVGQIVQSTGKYKYPMRVGESLAEMDQITIKQILNEFEEFTSTVVPNLQFIDLDKNAIERLRKLWAIKSQRKDYLMRREGITYAALILLGKEKSLQQFLPSAEIIFEWRAKPNQIAYDYRKIWRQGILTIVDNVWEAINARNIRFPVQEGFIQKDIWAFDEKSVREAVLNAVAHRDYRDSNRSIFIHASQEFIQIISPGGLIFPVTIENIIHASAWRNRLLAETLEKTGLVERSGQGIDDIFDKTLKDGKGLPQFSGTDASTVAIEIPARIEDNKFISYLEKVSKEKKNEFTLEEIIELENIRKAQKLSNIKFKNNFLKWGIIEPIGHGRGTKYILSHEYYQHDKRPGVYTRLKGVSRDERKLLIVKHLKRDKKATVGEINDIFPELSRKEVQNLLQELRRSKQLTYKGNRKSGYWKTVD